MEQLAGEMGQYRLAVLAVTETHRQVMLLDESTGCRMNFSEQIGVSRGSRTCILPLCMEGPTLIYVHQATWYVPTRRECQA